MLKKSIKHELLYQMCSKNIYWLLITVVLIIVGTFALNHMAVRMAYGDYQQSIAFAEEENIDIQEELNRPFTVFEESENGISLENPLAYDAHVVSQQLFAASGSYHVEQILESFYALMPFVGFIFGAIVAYRDYKYKTVKVKTIRIGHVTICIGQMLSLLLLILAMVIAGILLSRLLGLISFALISNKVPVDQFDPTQFTNNGSLLLQVLFTLLIAMVHGLIGYALSFICKNALIPTILFIGRLQFLPSFGRFDPNNIQHFFSDKLFDFYGIVQPATHKDISPVGGVLVFALYLIIPLLVMFLVMRKRSRFQT